jgi:amidohydrolase
MDTGHVKIDDGYVWAAVDSFSAQVIGQGGHGAYPHQTVDPIWLTSHVLNALYAIPSRRVVPLESNVVTVGVIQGGTVSNVIPDSVHLRGTLRSFDDDVREQLIQEVDRAMKVTRALGGDYELTIKRGYPATYNDPLVADWLRRVVTDLLGPESVTPGQRTMGGEDFSYMAQVAKGAMIRLGVKDINGRPRNLHTSTFDIDETALPVGTAIMAETARRFLFQELS